MQAEKLSGVYGRSPEGEVDVLLDARVALNLGRLWLRSCYCYLLHKVFIDVRFITDYASSKRSSDWLKNV